MWENCHDYSPELAVKPRDQYPSGLNLDAAVAERLGWVDVKICPTAVTGRWPTWPTNEFMKIPQYSSNRNATVEILEFIEKSNKTYSMGIEICRWVDKSGTVLAGDLHYQILKATPEQVCLAFLSTMKWKPTHATNER